MRGLTFRWIGPPSAGSGASSTSIAPSPAASIDGDALVRRVLLARGLDADAAREFCDPTLRALEDPSRLHDLDRAAERILEAARAGESIVIYGDYDVDGVTAATILQRILHALTPSARVSIYIPHRLDEGYGLSEETIARLANEGARLIVSVDCGVTATGPARAARQCGVDLIITDHHELAADPADLPEAFAIVHPRHPEGDYTFGELCGAGVAFKLAWRLATMAQGRERVAEPLRETLLDLLALAALGTVADVVPLVGENRVIARFGLARMKSTSIVGLNALISAADLDGERISAEHVGFVLGPRLNACGRLGHAREAAELLATDDRPRAEQIAAELTRSNDERRRVERAIFEQAAQHAEEAGMTTDDRRAIVLAHEQWHPGVIGIVCSRLTERLGRPAILLHRSNGMCHGSGRSVDDVDLHAALTACAAHLERFGGHRMAAGLALRSDNLERFTEAFTEQVNAALSVEALVPTIRYDCDAALTELSPLAVGRLESLAPHGRDNPNPTIRVRKVRLSSAEPLGSKGRHLKLRIEAEGAALRVVAWRWGSRIDELPRGAEVDVLIRPKINEWRGQRRVEAELADLARA